MVVGLIVWIIALAVFAYVYMKPGYKNSTQMVRFAPAVKPQPQASRDSRPREEARPGVTSAQPS